MLLHTYIICAVVVKHCCTAYRMSEEHYNEDIFALPTSSLCLGTDYIQTDGAKRTRNCGLNCGPFLWKCILYCCTGSIGCVHAFFLAWIWEFVKIPPVGDLAVLLLLLRTIFLPGFVLYPKYWQRRIRLYNRIDEDPDRFTYVASCYLLQRCWSTAAVLDPRLVKIWDEYSS